MSTLVVYFSFDGNTKFIAEKVTETISADMIELKTSKKYPREGFKKYFLGGKSVIFGEKPKLINERIDWNRYETIIIGTPVWAGRTVRQPWRRRSRKVLFKAEESAS